MNKKEQKSIKFNKFYIFLAFFLFAIIIGRIYILSSTTIYVDGGQTLQQFARNRTNRKEVLYAKRGTIYDKKGNVLAENTSSYTLIAHLNPKRTTDDKHPKHVVDIDYTATKLAGALNINKDKIIKYLTLGKEKGYSQVELGVGTKNLTVLKKDEIQALNLPGISFYETEQRHYPFGKFASYIIGYTRNKEIAKNRSIMIGEMGIESYFNDKLTGENGHTFYQKDRNGYKIAGTKEVIVKPKEGMNVYLTIDSTIQLFVEDAINKYLSESKADSIAIMMADAKTGAILASGTYPSFDPNKKNITNYLNLNTQVAFEPGSTMKIFTYMATMEEGKYLGSDTFKSGEYTTKDGTKIGDYNRKGWGTISYDTGFLYSSNTGVINLIENNLSREILKNYFLKLGFGSKTGLEVSKEASGKIEFKYQTEILNAGFGQGITTTPIQYIKALTAISNDGMLLKPYLIDKIVDPNTNKVVYSSKREEIERVASTKTVSKIKELMRGVINSTDRNVTGIIYKMPGYDLIAKTGTAQVAEGKKGYGSSSIRSLAGMFPGNDPKVIIYVAVKNPKNFVKMTEMVKTIIKNTSKYLNIYDETKKDNEILETITLSSYINKDIDTVKKDLESKNLNVVVIGDGSKVIKQYPISGSKVNKLDKIFLLTNSKELKMIDLKNYSFGDVSRFFNIINMPFKYNGVGFVINQNIKAGTVLNKDTKVIIEFKSKY